MNKKFSKKQLVGSAMMLAATLGSPAWAADSERDLKVLPPEVGIYHGVFPDASYTDSERRVRLNLYQFEDLAQKEVVWAQVDNEWTEGITFPKAAVDAVVDAGKIPLISMHPWRYFDRYEADRYYTFQRLADGDFDYDLRRWAKAAKDFNWPLMVEFAPEPNGDWFPWSGAFLDEDYVYGYGNGRASRGPEIYKDVYRRIINIFRSEGVRNVTWVFHVVNGNRPAEAWNGMSAYYPGDDYIDWVGISIYSAQYVGDYWDDFTETLDEVYEDLAAITRTKPLAILEWGIIEDPYVRYKKADWIVDALASLKDNRYPRIKGIGYWHESSWVPDRSNNMRIDSSYAARDAYRTEIADDFFVTAPVLTRDVARRDLKFGPFSHDLDETLLKLSKPGFDTVKFKVKPDLKKGDELVITSGDGRRVVVTKDDNEKLKLATPVRFEIKTNGSKTSKEVVVQDIEFSNR